MRLIIRAASTLAKASEAAPLAASSSVAPSVSATPTTQGRSRNQPPRPPKAIPEEFLQRVKAKKTHKRWNYTRMFQKTDIQVGPVSQPRILSHYNNTLASDLLYLTYRHGGTHKPQQRPERDVNNPYTLHRPAPQPKGGKGLRPSTPPTTHEHVVKLEKIVLHTMVKEVNNNRKAILSAMAMMRQLAGEIEGQGGNKSAQGIKVWRTRKMSVAFRMPRNVPTSVTVELKGEKMYEFIGSLVEFVLPRMRDFAGVVMPPPSASMNTTSAMSGVVAFGLPPSAMALFPQIEVNFDSYPRSHGMHIDFVTNARGKDAQNRARALVSGFRIPFVRK
ncbi:hypothetical protein FRB99_008011 [Tulasnella sp. 403]|nr:hypothetical protein FRB99_008011 [Tulasnella sp. 403]